MARPEHVFTDTEPTLDAYWRGIVLFGVNTASYKFALARSLLEMAEKEQEDVPLDVLAEPFARHLCQHLRDADKQGTFGSSRFLDACRAFNRGELDSDELREATARLGFQNVIDAFHVVGGQPVGVRFFEDERKARTRGIRLTDDLQNLVQATSRADLEQEAEARWRLVETAWELELPRHLLSIGFDSESEMLLTPDLARRKEITPARSALNGYQKGRCFYCFGPIGIDAGSADLAQVDHFFPHLLKRAPLGQRVNLDGVWNLVLACQSCNGANGKWTSLPETRYLGRLQRRNEYLIASHHPLRETLIQQTGRATRERVAFLQSAFDDARGSGLPLWHAIERGPATF